MPQLNGGCSTACLRYLCRNHEASAAVNQTFSSWRKPVKKGESGDFVTFNDAQCVTATSTIARAISQLRKDTLGIRISDRHAHMIMLLGTRQILEANGVELDPMTATRFQTEIETNFCVSDTAAEADVKALREMEIIASEADPDDGRKRIIVLTPNGEKLYRELAERVANLILAAAEILTAAGTIPASPRDEVRPFLKDFSIPIRRNSPGESAEDN